MESSADDVESLKAENERLKRDLQNALLQLSELKRHVFGRRTEKRSVISDAQTQLFEFKLPEVEDTQETEVKSHQRKKRKSRRLAQEAGQGLGAAGGGHDAKNLHRREA